MKKQSKPIPFSFVLEELSVLHPLVKPMFGCHAIYIGDKITLILRKKENSTGDNGVWIATAHEHHASLKRAFPSLRPIDVFGKDGAWQVLPEESDDFEEQAFKICALILKHDPRIGKIPKARKKKNS